MSHKNRSSPERRSTWPQSRPPIHKQSHDGRNNSDIQKRLTKSKDDFSFYTPESYFPTSQMPDEEMSDTEVDKASNTETDDDEKNSEISNYTDNEYSIPDSLDENEVKQHSTPIVANESVSAQNARMRFKNTNYKIPLYKNVSVSTDNSKNFEDQLVAAGTSKISNGYLTSNFISYYVAIICVLSFFCALFVCQNLSSAETFDMKSIKKKFTTQDEFLWIAFESGVEDVVKMNKPSTFILLYTKDAEDTVRDLIYELSKYAACNITDCSKEPIEISGQELNSVEVMNNYGLIIENYRDVLEENGVMIIRNLENVPGVSAQAFHSICDEFTPLVAKSLIIFTMKVDELPPSEERMRFVEEYFRNKWTDINNDTFHALITRITSMVIEVRA